MANNVDIIITGDSKGAVNASLTLLAAAARLAAVLAIANAELDETGKSLLKLAGQTLPLPKTSIV